MVAVDDENNTAGIYKSINFDMIERKTTNEENSYYFYAGFATDTKLYLSFSSGKFVVCEKPSEEDIEVRFLAEYNLKKSITSFFNY